MLFTSPARAEIKTLIEEYTYQASEADSKLSSRAIALEQVKRLLLEKLGTYLESETEVRNFQLTRDQIITLTAGIVRAEIIDEKWDGKTYSLKAKVAADPKDVYASIDKLRQDRQKIKELEEVRKTANELLREVERLRKELELAKKDQTKIARYDEAIKELNATDWYLKGISSARAGKYDEAIAANTKAIQLNPLYAAAYANRSFYYSNVGDTQQAVEDANKAIELAPGMSIAYINRGFAYGNLGNHNRTLEDANKAIELDPRNALGYVNRAGAYINLGNFQQALLDSNKAIELDPNISEAYGNRGGAYISLGNFQQVLEDTSKAIELDPKNATAYHNRGTAYLHLGDPRQAVRHFNRAIELNLKLAVAFQNRGFAYEQLGNSEGAMGDYKKACELGAKGACEKAISGSRLRGEKSTTRNIRVFKPGDYINYKLTGFVNASGFDVPIFGTAQYKVLNDTQVDYYGNKCNIFRLSMDFTLVGKDRSVKVARFVDNYFTQDLHGSLMIHGKKDNVERISSFVKTPSTGRYLAFKSPFNVHESVSQNIELADGSIENKTDMVLSEEQVSVPAGIFTGVKTISNTFTTNADLTKSRSMETHWLVPEIGPVRSNLEYSSDKESMKFILEMTDTNILESTEFLIIKVA